MVHVSAFPKTVFLSLSVCLLLVLELTHRFLLVTSTLSPRISLKKTKMPPRLRLCDECAVYQRAFWALEHAVLSRVRSGPVVLIHLSWLCYQLSQPLSWGVASWKPFFSLRPSVSSLGFPVSFLSVGTVLRLKYITFFFLTSICRSFHSFSNTVHFFLSFLFPYFHRET